MRKTFLFPNLLFALILFSSCEQPLEEKDFPYELKLVIRGILKPDKLIDSLYIGRTLPIGVPFDEDFANLNDAVGAVISDGVFYPLRYTANGIYTTDSLIARRGEKYYLLVQWQDKSASAETYIPQAGKLLNSGIVKVNEIDTSYSVIECTIDPVESEAYAVTWVLKYFGGQVIDESESFAEVVRSTSNEIIKVRSDPIPDDVLTSINTLGVGIYIYDRVFYDFYLSQEVNKIPTGIFGYPATNAKWNIKGDGIGLFIGRVDMIVNL